MSSPTAPPIASSLIIACITHIRQRSKLLGKDQRYHTLCHEFGRFRLWTHSFDRTPPADGDVLDEVLEEAIYLKEPTIMLLASFASCLLDKSLRKVGNDNTRALLGLSLHEVARAYPRLNNGLNRAWNTEDEVIRELRECVDSLFDMLSTLDDVFDEMQAGTYLPEEDIDEPVACPALGVGHHWEIYQQYIRDRFPQAMEGLDIEMFAKGNAKCYESLVTENELEVDEGVLVVDAKEEGIDGEQEKGEQDQELGYEDCEPEANQHLPIVPEESAINHDAAQNILELAKGLDSRGAPATFKDSGLGSSAPGSRPAQSISPFSVQPNLLAPSQHLISGTLLAPPPSLSAFSESTICSITSEPKNRRLLPRVPDHSRGSPGFNCPFCGYKQRPTTQGHAWRKHVFTDLAPYMCIRSCCPNAGTFYTSKKAWVAHDTRCIRDARKGAGETTTETCPFCLKDFGKNTGRFYSHVAHHMEDIRLFALPPAFREYETRMYEDTSGMGSSKHSESSGGDSLKSPIGLYVANNKAIDSLDTWKWAIEAQGEIDEGAGLSIPPVEISSVRSIHTITRSPSRSDLSLESDQWRRPLAEFERTPFVHSSYRRGFDRHGRRDSLELYDERLAP